MPNLRNQAEQARRTTGHPLFKNERQALIQIAKTWPGHRGVNFGASSSEAVYLLIMDALKRARTAAFAHLDCVGTNGGRASTETRS